MRWTIRQTVSALAVLFALGPLHASAKIYQVPDAAEGIATITDALARCLPGDEVQIAEGVWEEILVITTPSLTLRGMGEVSLRRKTGDSCATPPVTLLNTRNIHIENLKISGWCNYIIGGREIAPGAERISGACLALPVFPPAVGSTAVKVTNSTFYLSECELFGGGSLRPAIEASSSILSASHCLFKGGAGFNSTNYNSTGSGGGAGAELSKSVIYARQCVFSGGDGGDGFRNETDLPSRGGNGGRGILLSLSSAVLIDCAATGGDGGDGLGLSIYGWIYGGDGGHGIMAINDSILIRSGASASGGAGGSGQHPGAPGQAVYLDATSQQALWPSLEEMAAALSGAYSLSPGEMARYDINQDQILDVADLVRIISPPGF